MWFFHRIMSPKDADGIAFSVGPDQTAFSLLKEQSGLDRHCLLTFSSKIWIILGRNWAVKIFKSRYLLFECMKSCIRN